MGKAIVYEWVRFEDKLPPHGKPVLIYGGYKMTGEGVGHPATSVSEKGGMMPFKYGRKEPKRHPAIRFKDIFKAIPDHPIAADNLKPFKNWQMLGNDKYSDCLAVWWANDRRVTTGTLTTEYYPTLAQVLEFYKTQNPNFPTQDDGMEYQTALEQLNKVGGPDGVKAVAFAQVDLTNLEEVKAALAIFGRLALGIKVQAANETQFKNGKPWDYVKNSAIEGLHAVLGGGYSSNAKSDVTFVTWAQQCYFTDNFWAHDTDEAWVVIWPEHFGSKQFLQGIDIPKLAAAYKALTDRELPIPVTPTPDPQPVITDAVKAFIQWLIALLQKLIT